LHPESLAWLVRGAGTAAWQAATRDKVCRRHRHRCHMDMTSVTSTLWDIQTGSKVALSL
jgi:hypothetical protein